MLLGLHLLACKDLFDDALFVDDKGCSDSSHGLFAIHRLLSPSTHRLQEFMIDVSNQRGNGNSYFSLNFTCEAAESLLTPTTS